MPLLCYSQKKNTHTNFEMDCTLQITNVYPATSLLNLLKKERKEKMLNGVKPCRLV